MSRHTALITGAASGVGLGIAQALATENCHVLLSDNNFPAAEAGGLRANLGQRQRTVTLLLDYQV